MQRTTPAQATRHLRSHDAMGEPTLFELELFGGGIERRYRKMRPEVEEMPWGTLDLTDISPHDLIAARKA